MVTKTVDALKGDLYALGEAFWAGEAEIARTFLTANHVPLDHVHWLRHQCYRELRGPGLLARPHSRTEWLMDNINQGLPAAETKKGREELARQRRRLAVRQRRRLRSEQRCESGRRRRVLYVAMPFFWEPKQVGAPTGGV